MDKNFHVFLRTLDSPLSKAVDGLVLRSDAFVAKVRGLPAGRDADGEVPTLGALRRQAPLADVTAVPALLAVSSIPRPQTEGSLPNRPGPRTC